MYEQWEEEDSFDALTRLEVKTRYGYVQTNRRYSQGIATQNRRGNRNKQSVGGGK